ncbi:conjugal transfer protein TraA [Acetobacter sacchari]|uniref:Conjugal transfer protein TraA n=1 Tax=Acetobacter sacchari TaxID=2661687 RepID=A0ABS3LW96_9PROT|nr:conjugal transfer protein TraA [Acetobacter sacchari]MBO1360185.1 conjugal transfer protein TraA [Acetobacter sacchari]
MHGDYYRTLAALGPLSKEDLPSCVREAIFFLEHTLRRSIPGQPYSIMSPSKTIRIIYPQQHWVYLVGVIRRYRRTANQGERKLISRFMKTIKPLLPEVTPEPTGWEPPPASAPLVFVETTATGRIMAL